MWAVATVALRRFLRERSNLFFVFALPFLIIFLVGYSADSLGDQSIAVVGADTELGASILEHLPPDMIERFADRSSAIRAVEDNSVTAAVVFDEADLDIDFRSKSGRGLDSLSQLEAAVARVNQELVVSRQASVVGIDPSAARAALGASGGDAVEVETIGTVVWGGLSNLAASALTQVVLFTFLAALTASSFLVEDRTLGMATRKAAAPISIGRLVAGETLGRFLIAGFQAVLIVGVTSILFGIDWGNPIWTFVILALFGLVATGAGVLLGTVFNNPEAASGTGIALALVLAVIGGAMAPVEVFPETMQTMARGTPHFWAIDGLKASLTGGDRSGIVRALVVLSGFAIAILTLATAFYRRRTFRR